LNGDVVAMKSVNPDAYTIQQYSLYSSKRMSTLGRRKTLPFSFF